MATHGAPSPVIYQKHCPGCFVNKSGLAVCPHCGYDESAPRSPLYLPHGLIIGGQFRVGRVLGQPGGFGISYLAWDVHLQQRVAIKEYLPKALAGRAAPALDVVAHDAEHEAAFQQGLEHFIHEARVIARLDHPNVVRVRSFFRAHRTAYMVMDYYEGVSLGDYLAGLDEGRVDPQTAVRLLGPVLDGLQFVHDRGIVHRDIKPHNIYLASGGRAILLDFGAARQQAADSLGAGMAVVLSEGYAPLEQYQRDSQQGAPTDVYGVAATLYRMVIGASPPAALDRMGSDPLAADFGLNAPAFEAVLRRGLALRQQDRYPSAEAFRVDLYETLEIAEARAEGKPRDPIADVDTAPFDETAPRAATLTRPAMTPEATRPRLSHDALVIAVAILLGSALIALTLWFRP